MKLEESMLRAARAKKPWRPFLIYPSHEVLQHIDGLATGLAARPDRGVFRHMARGAAFQRHVVQTFRALRLELEKRAIIALGGRRNLFCLTFPWRGACFALSARFREADKVTLVEIGLADRALPALPPPPPRTKGRRP